LLHNCLNDFELASNDLVFVGLRVELMFNLLDFFADFLALAVNLFDFLHQLSLKVFNQVGQLFYLSGTHSRFFLFLFRGLLSRRLGTLVVLLDRLE
jgi:hypothetical protein